MKANKETIRKYYKHQYEDWTQPVLTSFMTDASFQFIDPNLSGGKVDDSTGVMTWGSAPVQRFTDIYKCFNSSTSDYWAVNGGNRIFSVFDILFGNPIKLSQIYIKGKVINSTASSLTGSQIYNVKPTGEVELLSTTADTQENTHVFDDILVDRIRVCVRPNSDGGSYPTRITEITITGQEQIAVESSEADYDAYEDIDVYSLPKKEDKYYGIGG